MAVYRGVNNGLLYDLWNTYELDFFGDGGDHSLMEFVAKGIEQARDGRASVIEWGSRGTGEWGGRQVDSI